LRLGRGWVLLFGKRKFERSLTGRALGVIARGVELVLLEQENDTLRKDYVFKWFLAGGGVLLLGMLIGRISGGSRRKRQSLLS